MHDTKPSETTCVQNSTNWWTISANSKLITPLQMPGYPNVRFWGIYFTGFPLFHQCWSALDSQRFFSILAGVTFSRISLLPHFSDFLRNSWVVCILCLNCCKQTPESIFAIYAHIIHKLCANTSIANTPVCCHPPHLSKLSSASVLSWQMTQK